MAKGKKSTAKKQEVVLDKSPIIESKEEIKEEAIIEEKPIEVIGLDNKPVSKTITEKVIPKGFVPTPNVKTEVGTMGIKNGKVYKVVSKGVGMYTDTGVTFKI